VRIWILKPKNRTDYFGFKISGFSARLLAEKMMDYRKPLCQMQNVAENVSN